MGACILHAQGMSVEDAVKLIKARRRAADPDVYYMKSRILKFAQQWKLEGEPA